MDVDGLHITVTAGDKKTLGGKKASGAKAKAKARSEGVETLANTKLRLKAGQRYALVGRNGSGKSSKKASFSITRLVPA